MERRQTSLPQRWLVADTRLGRELLPAIAKLPRGSGILFLYRDLPKRQRARLLLKVRRLATRRSLVIVDEEAGEAARVHDAVELRQARLAGAPLLFLSPIFVTRSHKDWQPLPRMRAAALLRLANAAVIALGGMDERRFKRVRQLGFYGWAGIDAWIRT
jgi:thiamine-phosphate pyrophosphorylase